MSDQLLIPFKAKFVLHVKTTMLQFFKDSEKVSLVDKFKTSTDNIGNIDIKSAIKNNQYGSKIYQEYKELYFKFHQAFDIHPENMIYAEDFELEFKLESFQIEVLQITNQGKEILFSDSDGKVKTVSLNDNLSLIKIQ